VTNVAAPLAGIFVSSGGTDRPCPRPPPLCRVAVMQYSPDKPRDLCGCTLMHHRPLDAVSDAVRLCRVDALYKGPRALHLLCLRTPPLLQGRSREAFQAEA
jgi:hypothetical protein